ncbi:MAG: aspartate kinase [Streptococcaceae bacterium]|nr:aspartate kinase [Streptococcaceae bacterium]
MKVTKFGGSSLASAGQIRKVFEIVSADRSRRFVVVSAPGKRSSDDIKVTDLLIDYFTSYKLDKDFTAIQSQLIGRFQEIVTELDLAGILPEITNRIYGLAKLPLDNGFTYDSFLATGEDLSARIVAEFFNKNGLTARYVSPREAGLFVSNRPSHAELLPEAYAEIEKLIPLAEKEILVIPGFFGMTRSGEVCTFSRGGSDITGSIIAAAVKAELYENFTDVDGIFSANPNTVENPVIIEEVTYREMRELSFAGFSVLHEESLIPAARAGVPMVLRNTNNLSAKGTRIVPQWTIDMPVVGIASSSGFVIVKINKYLLYRDLSFGRKFFEILENLGIQFEAITTGIDDISILVREIYLSVQVEKSLTERVLESLQPDDFSILRGLSVVTAVSEEIRQQTHITSRATTALANEKIKIETLMQGASEVTLLFIVLQEDEKKTVRTLYQEFFEKL